MTSNSLSRLPPRPAPLGTRFMPQAIRDHRTMTYSSVAQRALQQQRTLSANAPPFYCREPLNQEEMIVKEQEPSGDPLEVYEVDVVTLEVRRVSE